MAKLRFKPQVQICRKDTEIHNIYIMKKRHFYTFLLMLAGMVFVSCSESDNFNPFNEQTKGEFNPTEVTFYKSSDNMETTEKWSDIERDKNNRITSYNYTREIKGYINEKETRVCRIDYYTNHKGSENIRTRTEVDFYKIDNNGNEEKYTESVEEKIEMNSSGYITIISTTTDHLDSNSKGNAVTTTSERTFTYNGDLCTGSTYCDADMQNVYKYNWNAYQLKSITVIKENKKDNTTDYSTYNYTFDTKDYYRYSPNEILPFVQNGFPQIFASMGYLGKFTPYVLTGEIQGGYNDYGDGSGPRPKIEVRNTYILDVDNNQKLHYSGVSNIYNAYSVTLSK